MKCPQCDNEMFIDHTERNLDGTMEKYSYVCVNPQCRDYRRAVTLTGEEVASQIQPKPSR